MPNPRDPRSISVVEIAIVLAIMATLSLFAIPAFQSRRILENEGSARRTLRDIVAAQRTFAAGHSGTTYGFLSELLGEGPLRRGVSVRPKALMAAGMKPQPPYYGKDGYLFAVYLPGRGSTSVSHDSWSNLASESAGKDFLAVAWPVNAGYSGQSVYVVDAAGRMMEFRNQHATPWSGFHNPPPPCLLEDKERLFGVRPLYVRALKPDTVDAP